MTETWLISRHLVAPMGQLGSPLSQTAFACARGSALIRNPGFSEQGDQKVLLNIQNPDLRLGTSSQGGDEPLPREKNNGFGKTPGGFNPVPHNEGSHGAPEAPAQHGLRLGKGWKDPSDPHHKWLPFRPSSTRGLASGAFHWVHSGGALMTDITTAPSHTVTSGLTFEAATGSDSWAANARRLFSREQVTFLLQLSNDQLQQLIDTRQLVSIQIVGEERFCSRDVSGLIGSYVATALRRSR